MKTLNEIADAVHALAWEKGWHTDGALYSEDAFVERACNNLHDEVSELHEAWRNNQLRAPCDKAAEMAEDTRAEATESDDREGIVREFLNHKVNADWYKITPEDRVFLQNDETFEGQYQREYVSNAEIWSECFGRPISTISGKDSYDIAVMMS